MLRSCAIVLLFLISLLVHPAVGRSQVNRRLAIDYVKLGTNELEAGNLETALAHFEHAIELDRNYGAAYSAEVRQQSKTYFAKVGRSDHENAPTGTAEAATVIQATTISMSPNLNSYLNRTLERRLRDAQEHRWLLLSSQDTARPTDN
jgi:tetratricopeptide (TPR) repeat protein